MHAGGLRDTVITFNRNNPEGTTGFAFENVGADSLKAAIWDALELYRCVPIRI